jgi:hypothetical protein
MTDNIYVDLFSNSSLNLYPNNRVSSFTVKLNQPLSFDGEYECALAQMICPATTSLKIGGQIVMSTFPEGILQKTEGQRKENTPPYNDISRSFLDPRYNKDVIHAAYRPGREGFSALQYYSFVYDIPKDKAFVNGAEVVTFINELFSSSVSATQNKGFADVIKTRTLRTGEKFPAKFEIDKDGLHVTIRDPDFSIAITGPIGRVLGFDVADNQWVVLNERGVYDFPRQKADLDASKPSLLAVYTNIILPHHVGDTAAPLIRACTMPKTTGVVGELLNFQFDTLHYLPIAVKYIQEIVVEVRGNDGSLIPFQAGMLYIRLHFKSRRQ